MQQFTKEQQIAITGFTGVMACTSFSDFHEAVENKLGRQVWTHQFPSLMNEIKDAFRDDFIALIPRE